MMKYLTKSISEKKGLIQMDQKGLVQVEGTVCHSARGLGSWSHHFHSREADNDAYLRLT